MFVHICQCVTLCGNHEKNLQFMAQHLTVRKIAFVKINAIAQHQREKRRNNTELTFGLSSGTWGSSSGSQFHPDWGLIMFTPTENQVATHGLKAIHNTQRSIDELAYRSTERPLCASEGRTPENTDACCTAYRRAHWVIPSGSHQTVWPYHKSAASEKQIMSW